MATNNSVNTSLSGQTGTGNFVGANTPTLITPVLGVSSATSLNFGASATSGILGITGGSTPSAGVVGEVLSNSTNNTALTNNTAANATSVSLTAGYWLVWGTVTYIPGGATTISNIQCGIGQTSATLPGIGVNSSLIYYSWTFTPALNQALGVTPCVINLSSTTTVYLVAQATFGVSTLAVNGFIAALRLR